ncbi:major facilitator superfamily domain-containing protein 6 [Drosophila elegans]|uniref:major facilitator superfamily domain-containing protein 6 n=1 Tax=Drosophila elegans TaxID=30023 RepID=UPI0007E7E709|nr:major facilitator superfamily domain-containing protein 6 [Drosophila elegans]XP_017124994.1 major facilitator superfamily domain-containing protein 6 [Drosophila elegans]XP_017124995.1 major facilitator superfamily domain-containing protein 6 [Drosophila elegans]XP_041563236.1 major facilitator superfamily domain-containing protein 6 [Drosophila elegans]XP_041563237.1 major facilitator superfamily domain-containing protein 6 [Drosophila elegans]
MVRLNRRLLPIKAHFFFFMAAMGPILPQLPVIGKQIGVPPDVMGYIMAVLPILYVLAKPMVGFLVDYFTSLRKFIFIALILIMTLAFAGFYFLPDNSHFIPLEDASAQWNVSILETPPGCSSTIYSSRAFCQTTHQANCIQEGEIAELPVLIVAYEAGLNLSQNMLHGNDSHHMCLSQPASSEWTQANASCHLRPVNRCIYGAGKFWLFVCLLCIGIVGFNVTNSISDACCFDLLGEEEQGKYGAQRVWGTIGFGATALLAGVVVNWWTTDAIKSLTPALIIMCVFSLMDLFSVSRLKLPKLGGSESIWSDVWQLVRQPPIVVFLFFATMAGVIDSFIIYFMFWHLEQVAEATGYMHQIKLIEGLVVAAECLAGEVPFFFYSGNIIKKLGYVHCMSMCFFFYAVRLSLIAWIPNPWYLVGVELFFQGITYALCYTCIVAYASAVAPPGTSATVQGLMAGMDDGLGFSIGSLIGGLMFNSLGGRESFKYFAIAAICTCVAHIVVRPTSRKRQFLPKQGYQPPPEQEIKHPPAQELQEIR